MISKPQLEMIVRDSVLKAKEMGIEDADATFKTLIKLILQERYKNPINAAFDRTGFW